jgi:DeoR/GlpR family transcriptional regulator of sugar metabolism
LSEKRLEKVSELVKQKGSLTVQELMEYFQVSDMTIRRDLQKLEQNGKFQRFHGGIRYLEEPPLNQREAYKITEKLRLAKYCLTLIQPGDTIILDSGTTVYQVAAALAESNIRDITVITNSLANAYRLRHIEGITLIMCGGELRQSSQSFIGSKARDFFENIYVNKAFIGTGGITEKGFSTANFAEAEIKQCMINVSENTFVVADSTKFGHRSLNLFAPLQSADRIITDTDVSEEWEEFVKKNNVELVKV